METFSFFGFIVYLLLFMINLWLLYISTLSANSTVYGFQIIFECIFFTIITIYIFQLSIMTMLLIVDKNLTQMKSFAICFKAINKHCFKNISLGLFTWFLAIFFYHIDIRDWINMVTTYAKFNTRNSISTYFQ